MKKLIVLIFAAVLWGFGFYFAEAAVLNKVLSGFVASSTQQGNVSIEPVNTSNAFTICYSRVGSSNPSSRVGCNLTDSKNLQVSLGAIGVVSPAVQWQVVEFKDGVNVQRGGITLTTETQVNVTISSVNTAKAFVLITESASSTTQTIDEFWTVTAQLTTATNLQLTRNSTETNTPVTVFWQVIEIDTASVQSNTAQIADTQTSTTGSLSPSVNTDKTFVVFTRRAGDAINGIEGQYSVRAELTDANTITFTRIGTSNAVDIIWYAVEMTDSTFVQKGLTSTAATADTNLNPELPSSYADFNRTAMFVSVSGGDNTQTANLDEVSWTPKLIPRSFNRGNTLSLVRASSGTNADLAWFAVEFPKRSIKLRGNLRLRGKVIRLGIDEARQIYA